MRRRRRRRWGRRDREREREKERERERERERGREGGEGGRREEGRKRERDICTHGISVIKNLMVFKMMSDHDNYFILFMIHVIRTCAYTCT